MLNIFLAGVIGMASGLIVGIITPTIITRIKDKNVKRQLMLRLSSVLFLLKNNLKNFLYQDLILKIVPDEDDEGEKRLNYFREQINVNVNNLYTTQQEVIIYFKKEIVSVIDIYKLLNDIDQFIWTTRNYYNNNKSIFDQESSDSYSSELDKFLEDTMTIKINKLINLNLSILKL